MACLFGLSAQGFADASGKGDGLVGAMGEKAYGEMLARSLLSTGNNYRMKAAIEKTRRGENVTIAYIGGSITEGYNASVPDRCFARRSVDTFRELFAKDGKNVSYLNAGMAGTPSTLGMIRYKRDVLDRLKALPDIVFVEFAVNDGDDPTNGAAFESLVLDILGAKNHPAVVLVFGVFKSRWNLEDALVPVGERYGLPMISIKAAVVPELDSGRMGDGDFFSDLYHPTDAGHRVMADCIAHYFRAVDGEIPAASDIAGNSVAVIGNRFTGIRMIGASGVPSGIKISRGSFSTADSALGSFGREAPLATFPDNWHRNASSLSGDFVMEITCKNLVIVYKKSARGSSFGMADAYVDGELVDSYDGEPSNGWNNPWTSVLIDEEKAARHTVKITMSEESEGPCFTILAFGYTE